MGEMTPAEIAASLPPGQVRALEAAAKQQWVTPIYACIEAIVARNLETKGLFTVHRRSPAQKISRAQVSLTPLGRAVLAELEKRNG